MLYRPIGRSVDRMVRFHSPLSAANPDRPYRSAAELNRNATHAPRTVAARVLSRWLLTGDFPDRLIPPDTPQRNLIQEMVFGTVRWCRLLEWILSGMVKREPDPETKAYLLTGLYQLFRMDNIPPHAALNETVEAAKADLEQARIRFVNGVLRNALRQRDQITTRLDAQPVGIRLSHPDHLIKRWQQQYGDTTTTALCEWNNQRPEVTIRLRGNHPAIHAALREQLRAHPHATDFLCVPTGHAVNDLPGFSEGAFYVQDPATQMAITLLDPKPGMRVLDACAAPGGKAFACADRMQNQGRIIAMDLHHDRMQRLQENADRMQCACLDVVQGDATRANTLDAVTRHAPFDRILLDVPCSNTGVLNRRPDARWRFSKERLEALLSLQARILDATAPLLSQDGLIVYSTCSLEDEENLRQVHTWLAANPAFRLDAQRMSLPPESGMDGAFAATIRRT
jgi:16S rRNA (cytosine967-C5)-methyltransferase